MRRSAASSSRPTKPRSNRPSTARLIVASDTPSESASAFTERSSPSASSAHSALICVKDRSSSAIALNVPMFAVRMRKFASAYMSRESASRSVAGGYGICLHECKYICAQSLPV